MEDIAAIIVTAALMTVKEQQGQQHHTLKEKVSKSSTVKLKVNLQPFSGKKID